MHRPTLYIWSGFGAVAGYTTGVGKHAKNMGHHLSARPEWHTRLVLARDQQPPGGASTGASVNGFVQLPFTRAQLDMIWSTIAMPAADHWLPENGWIYCPKEKYVPVQRLRYAVTVHDIYGFEDNNAPRSVRHALRLRRFRRMIHDADVVLVVSDFTKRRLLERFDIDPAKVSVVGNGVEDEFFDAFETDPERTRGEFPHPYVLFVGGLRRKKGAPDILRFAKVLHKADPSVAIIVVGPVDSEFQNAISSHRNLHVVDRGFEDAKMIRLVRGASVAMSLSAYEGFGIPLLEAMAAGVPVVAADRHAFPEVVADAGALVDSEKPGEIVEIVMELIRDARLREDYIGRGRYRAAAFRWSCCADRVAHALVAFDQKKML